MTEQEHVQPAPGAAAFAGAQRAAGYVEDPYTVHGQELDAVRAVVRQVAAEVEAEGAAEPVEIMPPPSRPVPVQPLHQVTPTPVAPAMPAAPAIPPVAPASTPADMLAAPLTGLATAAAVEPPAIATKGMRGRLSRLGIRMAPGAAEAAELAAAAAQRGAEQIIRQATWTRAVSVLVTNPKGGTGKTPTSLLLGGVLAAVRGGSVAIVEVADDPGALTFRAEGNPPRGIGELVQDVEQIRTAGQLAGYTAPQTSFASVIGSTGRRAQLTGADVARVAALVDEFYSIRVMDSGNQPSSSAYRGAVEVADALVIPVMNAGDAVLDAVALLDGLRGSGGRYAALAANAIVLRITDGRPEHPQVVERVDQILAGAGVAQVYPIPYDAHIAERGQLTLDALAPSTRQAFTAAAAGVVSYLQHSIR